MLQIFYIIQNQNNKISTISDFTWKSKLTNKQDVNIKVFRSVSIFFKKKFCNNL